MRAIDKDTKVYCSFSTSPGNNGCVFFNKRFQERNINAIYKSFYSDNIQDSVQAAKTLGIAGFGVSMPFKLEVLQYVDEVSEDAKQIGAANTIINNNGHLIAHNTDWIGVSKYFLESLDFLSILGDGGFSKAVQYMCLKKDIPYQVITRKDWGRVYDLRGYIFNATPIDINTSGYLIDGRPFTNQGRIIAELQAEEQFKLYINE